ncbi:very short patch repair endonuclease [Ruegeria sp. HKCCA0235A]|uniref:very short patch repair endonuclease n=1 Tax=Ruegeria sp. HKCCA0235A TaxID=2682998 RepID=UPI0020C345D9|nr:very short patch repair endonuclease [Ruegeria sp. HKCCA0235A]
MAAIKSRDTKPELVIRKALHARGFRYRLHSSSLPGKPDLVFKKHRAVIFVHGCFWHGHNCPLFRWPATRQEFWRAKITGNQERDRRVEAEILNLGWRVGVVWECALKGREHVPLIRVIDSLSFWLSSDEKTTVIPNEY